MQSILMYRIELFPQIKRLSFVLPNFEEVLLDISQVLMKLDILLSYIVSSVMS